MTVYFHMFTLQVNFGFEQGKFSYKGTYLRENEAFCFFGFPLEAVLRNPF